MSIKRKDVKDIDKWAVNAIFENDDKWIQEHDTLNNELKKIIQFKGKLDKSADNIKKLFDLDIELSRRLEKLYIYSHMKHDEDSKIELYKKYYELAYSLYIEYTNLTSWVEPELLKIDDKKIKKYLNTDELKPYKFAIEKIYKRKKHTLSEKEEKLLSMAQDVLSVSSNAFRSLNDGDLKFGFIKDQNDKELEITHGKYMLYQIDKNRNIRKKSFIQYHNKFNDFALTIASLIQGQVKAHYFTAKARNFDTCLQSALFNNNIDIKVYKNLINTVKEKINVLHEYMSFRKKMMKLDELHLYDIYVPFVDSQNIKISYEEACDLLFNCVKPLGDEYTTILKNGIIKERWVDKYENENKRSGAYSTGSYDTLPYILMNYNNTLNSARTLVHEAGHSMHSYYTHKNQPPIYGNYPIFLAEVASTFNEELFNNYLIQTTNDKNKTAYFLNNRLEEIRATFFRQTMFAEFELIIHELVEKNIPLTFQLLKKEYRKLNEFYFGKDVVIDKEIEIEWARIPHFYYNFYVYQYATGISAAIALYNRVINGGEKERIDYLNFLKSGCSKYPIDTLKNAGVDMTSTQPIEDTINYFKNIMIKLKKILI